MPDLVVRPVRVAQLVGFVDDGQIELFLDLQSPLLADGRRADHQQPATALGPVLAQNNTRLDCLAEAHLVGQDNTLGKRGLQREKRRLDLMGIQIHGGIKERHGQAVESGRRAAGEIESEILGVIGGQVHRVRLKIAGNYTFRKGWRGCNVHR